MVIGTCWWLIRKWSRPQDQGASGHRTNLNRRATDTSTQRSTEGSTLKAHDLELRRLESESKTLRQQLDRANAEISKLRTQVSGSANTDAKSRARESLADSKNA